MPSWPPERLPRVVRRLDWLEPEAAFARLCRQRFPIWLDSGGVPTQRSRYSYLCIDPVSVLEKRDGSLRHDGIDLPDAAFDAMAAMVRSWRSPVAPGPVPFTGGMVGLLGYGLARELEQLPSAHDDDGDLPELWLGFYDLLLAFDRVERTAWVISSGFHPDLPPADRADWLQCLLAAPAVAPSVEAVPALSFQPDLSPPEYRRMVERGLGYIRAGDIFQANLATRHVASRPAGLDPAAVHLALRRANPASFGAFIGWEDGRALVSASPERFIRLEPDGRVETRPVKGTSPRLADPQADKEAIRRLSDSVKDRAENLMIVDLMRNDLARVARPGSVSVPALFEVDSIATLHHLVSTVTATLRDGEDAVSLLRSAFPGGSVTGAPKIRAMGIIDELEASSRGPYCGCVVWIGQDGAMDSSIVIRTLLLTRKHVVAHAGGGIVADSDPEAEHREMLAKVDPLLSIFR